MYVASRIKYITLLNCIKKAQHTCTNSVEQNIITNTVLTFCYDNVLQCTLLTEQQKRSLECKRNLQIRNSVGRWKFRKDKNRKKYTRMSIFYYITKISDLFMG